jgi:glycosyltransferase involved in cell wall biosynthesis
MVKKISVAVNSWDCFEALRLFIKSYTENTEDQYNTELCIALDGSSNEMSRFVDLMCTDRNIKYSWSSHHGISYSINQAFKLCSNEYVVWLSDDYVFMPGWDTLLRKYLHPEHYVSMYTFEPHNSPFPSREGLDYAALMSYLSTTGERITGELGYAFGNGAFSADKMRTIGGFDENLIEGSMDGDFIYRMHKAFPELIFFKPPDISFYHFSRSTRGKHPELLESCDNDTVVFTKAHGHGRGQPLYDKIKKHCADKVANLEARGIRL